MKSIALHTTQSIMNHRERVFAILVGCCVLGAVVYGYSLQKAIVNVVQREEMVKLMQRESSAVADLESKYFSLKNAVSLDLAHRKGFKDAPVAVFISKKALGSTLTLNNEL